MVIEALNTPNIVIWVEGTPLWREAGSNIYFEVEMNQQAASEAAVMPLCKSEGLYMSCGYKHSLPYSEALL